MCSTLTAYTAGHDQAPSSKVSTPYLFLLSPASDNELVKRFIMFSLPPYVSVVNIK